MTKSAILVCLALVAPPGIADDDDDDKWRSSVTVSFGRGLNTAQPGNPVNHAILPNEIKVKMGGVVDFGVAGFHDIIIFKPGVKLDDLIKCRWWTVSLVPASLRVTAGPGSAAACQCRLPR